MRITDPSQLSVGMKIYTVCSFAAVGQNHLCALYVFNILEVPVKSTQGQNTFIKISVLDTFYLTLNGKWDQQISNVTKNRTASMQDMGIIPNKYNHHQTFFDIAEAQNYALNHFKLPGAVPIKDTQAQSDVICDYERAMKVVQ